MSQIIKKKWGQETILVNDRYCMKIMTITKGHSCSLHFHRNKQETFFIISGKLLLTTIDPKTAIKTLHQLSIGEYYTLMPGTPHTFSSETPTTVFLECSTKDMPEDSYRIVASS